MAKRKNYPRREKKRADRLLALDEETAKLEAEGAAWPFDRKAREMDAKWGIDRLPELVSPETAAKYAMCLGKLNDAIRDKNRPDAEKWAGVLCRGLDALDAEAEAAGHRRGDPNIVEFKSDDAGLKTHFAIMLNPNEWPCGEAPDCPVYTLREIGIALAAFKLDSPVLREVQRHFPQGELTALRDKNAVNLDLQEVLDDEIPF